MPDFELPGILADIERVAGFPAALAIAETFGGRRLGGLLRIKLAENHPLVQSVGPDAARKIVEEFAGERLDIPKCDGYGRQLRNRRIKRDRALGATWEELAGRYNLSWRHVARILNEDNPARLQTGFDW